MTDTSDDAQRTFRARVVTYDSAVATAKDIAVAVEAPINIVYGDTP